MAKMTLEQARAFIDNYYQNPPETPESVLSGFGQVFEQERQKYGVVDQARLLEHMSSNLEREYGKEMADMARSRFKVDPGRNLFAYANDGMIAAGNAVTGMAKSAVDFVAPGSSFANYFQEKIDQGNESRSDAAKLADYRLQQGLADDQSTGDKIGAIAGYAASDPVSALGTVAGYGLGAAALARLGGVGLSAAANAAMGSGAVRGQIYDDTVSADDKELMSLNPEYRQLRQTMSEADAKYEIGTRFWQHLPEIAAGGGVGFVAGRSGLEGALAKTGAAKPLMTGLKEVGGEALEEGVQTAAANYGYSRIDPRRELTEGVESAALMGAAYGVPLGGLALASPQMSATVRAADEMRNADLLALEQEYTARRRGETREDYDKRVAETADKFGQAVAETNRKYDDFTGRLMADVRLGKGVWSGDSEYEQFARMVTAGQFVPSDTVAQGVPQRNRDGGLPELWQAAKAKIRDLAGRVSADKSLREQVDLVPVSPQEAELAKQHGLDIAGFTHMIDSSAINHVLKNHGNEKTERNRGNVAVTADDFETVADVIANPDTMVFGGSTRLKRDAVFYVKKMDDGSTAVIEEVRTGKRKMAVTSMRKYPPTTHASSILKTLSLNARDGFGGSKVSIVQKPYSNNPLKANTAPTDLPTDRIAPTARERAAAASTQTGRVVAGKADSVDVSGRYEPVVWELREASDMGATVSKAENQYRDRNRAASEQQINHIAANLDFRKISESPFMDFGAPVLAKDGETVIGGNGRVAAVKQAYAQGTAENYRQQLAEHAADFGFTPETVAAFEQPVLVRRLQNDVDIKKAAIASNEGAGLAMSSLELAKTDASRLPPLQLFTHNESGSLNTPANRSAIAQFVGNFPQNQQAALQDANGMLSREGLRRLENAMLYQAYGDSPALQRMVESNDVESRNVGNALAQSAGVVADARNDMAYGDLYDLDIAADLVQAADLIESLRSQGRSVQDYLAQQDFADTVGDTAKMLLAYLDGNIRSAKKIRDLIHAYYGEVRALGNPKEGDMFGGNDTVTRQQLLRKAIHEQSGDFGTETQPGNTGADADGETGNGRAAEAGSDEADLQSGTQSADGAGDGSGVETVGGAVRPQETDEDYLADGAAMTDAEQEANDVLFSLDESADSVFARAVDKAAGGYQGDRKRYIRMGTTPDVLKMLGLPDTAISMREDVFNKAMGGKHNLTAADMKALPREINNPVAVAKSRSTDNGYVVFTELTEHENGKEKPIIAALHLKTSEKGLEVIDVASAYGRSKRQIEADLQHTLYWNKEKGYPFVDRAQLQLPVVILNKDNLSSSNIKTETDLAQYRSGKTPTDLTEINTRLRRALGGERAALVQVVDSKTAFPKDWTAIKSGGIEGSFNRKTGELYLFADNLTPERAVWVAWHELGHRGFAVKGSREYLNTLDLLGRNETVAKMADRIQRLRRDTDDAAATVRSVAVEEAVVELYAAQQTGNWAEIETRYGVEISDSLKRRAGNWLKRIAETLRRVWAMATGRREVSDREVLEALADIHRDNTAELDGDLGGDVLFSKYSDDADKVNRAFEIMTEPFGDRFIVSRDSSRISNSEYVEIYDAENDEGFKVRVSDHSLPAHHRNPYEAKFEVFPRGGKDTNSRGEDAKWHTDGSWVEAVEKAAEMFGLEIPPHVKAVKTRMERKAEQGEQSKPARKAAKRNPNAKRIKELKARIAQYEEMISWNQGESEAAVSNRKYFSERIAEFKAEMESLQDSGSRFSRSHDADFARKAAVLQGEPVAVISERKAPQGFKALREWAAGLFKQAGGAAVNPEVGEIALNERAVRDSIAHGMNPFKAEAFAVVPEVIEQGVVIHQGRNPDNGAEYVYISAPVMIEGKDDVVTLLARNTGSGRQMYLHSVVTKESILNASDTETAVISRETGKVNSGYIANILRNYLNYKPETENSLSDMRFSRADLMTEEQVREFAETGEMPPSDSVWQDMQQAYRDEQVRGRLKDGIVSKKDKLLEAVEDAAIQLKRWADGLPDLVADAPMRQLLEQAFRRAPNMRNAKNQEIQVRFVTPLNKELSRLQKKYKGKSLVELKNLVGYWMSAKYAPTANKRLIERAEAKVEEAKAALAKKETAANKAALTRAEKELAEYRASISGKKQGKTAGGFSNPVAAKVKADIEQHIELADLEAVAGHVRGMLDFALDLDLESGMISKEMYDEFKVNVDYVPFTGNPYDPLNGSDDERDVLFGGGSGINQARDKQMKGRVSMAQNGIDAAFGRVAKSTANYGYADFKNKLNTVYERALRHYLDMGLDEHEAKKRVAEEIGIARAARSPFSRNTDNVIFHKVDGRDVEFSLRPAVMAGIVNANREEVPSFVKPVQGFTRLYARGVTQFAPAFAPMNAFRDIWEKTEMIRVMEGWNEQGGKVDMDKVARQAWANFTKSAPTTFNAAWKGDFSGKDGKLLKQFLDLGGVSTYGTMLAKTETDMLKHVARESGTALSVLKKGVERVEQYNQMFDLMPGFSLFKALTDNGVSAEAAAGLVLGTADFNKRGAKMGIVRALYIFSQPTAMGAANLGRLLATAKGQRRFVGQAAAAMVLYSLLRGMEDEDNGGNKLDQEGDMTRYIPIPMGGELLKIPVGFGLPQLVWNFATNSVKAMEGDITAGEAFGNMLAHWSKTVAPVSPSEISVAKYPGAKLAMTVTPTVFQPIMQNVLNRNAFGSQITKGFVREDVLKAEQSKTTTAPEWKSAALWLQRNFGIDLHPEQIQNLVNGYAVSVLRDGINFFIENPNREALGRQPKTLFFNSIYGPRNEFAIQSRYYEAVSEASEVFKEFESRKRHGDLSGWLDDEKRAVIAWYKRAKSAESRVSRPKARATRLFNKGGLSEERMREVTVRTIGRRADMQSVALGQWRKLKGLNTAFE